MEKQQHTWDLWITTGSYEGDCTRANITMSFYGPSGCTPVENFALTADGEEASELFQVGATDHFEVRTGAWKELKKVKVFSDNSGEDPSWFVEKIKMKNRETKDEIRFEAGLWISGLNEHGSDLAVEFPAIYPDRPAYPRTVLLVFILRPPASDDLGSLRKILRSLVHYLRPYSSRRKRRNIQATELTTANRCYTMINKPYLSFWFFFWAGRDCDTLLADLAPLPRLPRFQTLGIGALITPHLHKFHKISIKTK